ncbi:hypothetical protein HY571_02815 [Candidatus Micrarchaeota archaeon]|nr:hypothetical protein [Candidatus Micrarchaeota archaeon]
MNWKIIVVVFIISLAAVGFYLSNQTGATCSPIHWHPNIRIIINGEERTIPSEVGIRIGKVIDTELSGMRMAPTHTHSSDGVIHMENNCPNKKPETYTLGYFFKVWNQTFNNTCIFDYCNADDKKVRLSINGGENTKFENYSMRDGNEIVISYN